MEENKLPCGFDADSLDCVDCCGYGSCEDTKEPDLTEQLKECLHNTFGFDIDEIKRRFE